MASISTETRADFPHPYFSALTPEEATEAFHEMLDWEGLMQDGTMPSLPLGAERRLRR